VPFKEIIKGLQYILNVYISVVLLWESYIVLG
jgi:hypothetical protein